MHSKNRPTSASWLMLAMLLFLTACSAPPTNSPPPLIVSNAEPTPLPAAITSIDPTPSRDYSQKAGSFLQRLDAWSQKASALLAAETAKSQP